MRTIALRSLYLLYFLDLAGIALTYVVFFSLILGNETGMVGEEISSNFRSVIVGFLFASHPIGQFFGSPLIREISNRWGRKRGLLASSLSSGFSFILTAAAIAGNCLPLLFVSRMMAGLSAGNSALTQAAISDLTEEKGQGQYMAILSALGGAAWLISYYNGTVPYASSFLIVGLLFLLCALGVWFAFRDHSQEKGNGAAPEFSSSSPSKALTLILSSAIAVFAWVIYQNTLSIYLEEKYGFSDGWIGCTYTYFSCWWIFGGLLIKQWFLKRVAQGRTKAVPFLIAALAVGSYLVLLHSSEGWCATAYTNFAMAIGIGSLFALFSYFGNKDSESKVLDCCNGGFASIYVLAPMLSGLSEHGHSLAFIMSR